MKKEYVMPTARFHRLRCRILTTESNEAKNISPKLFRYIQSSDDDYNSEAEKGVDEWG